MSFHLKILAGVFSILLGWSAFADNGSNPVDPLFEACGKKIVELDTKLAPYLIYKDGSHNLYGWDSYPIRLVRGVAQTVSHLIPDTRFTDAENEMGELRSLRNQLQDALWGDKAEKCNLEQIEHLEQSYVQLDDLCTTLEKADITFARDSVLFVETLGLAYYTGLLGKVTGGIFATGSFVKAQGGNVLAHARNHYVITSAITSVGVLVAVAMLSTELWYPYVSEIWS